MSYLLGIDSSTAITIEPDFSSKFPVKKIQTEFRTKSGKLYVYNWGDYGTFNFNLEYITEIDYSIINSWWTNNTELLLFVVSDSITEIHSVMIRNDDSPLAQYNAPYNNMYKGSIQLETY